MDTKTLTGFMDVIVIACGAYLLYGYYLLIFKNEIKEGVVISKAYDPKKCKDLEGFKKMIGPKLLLLAIIAIVSGGIGLFQSYVMPIPPVIYWVFYGIFLALIVWFAITSRKAQKMYFE